jgi:hypothetical protein
MGTSSAIPKVPRCKHSIQILSWPLMSDPCGRASSSFFVRGLAVIIADSAKHLHLTVELRPSHRPSFGYRARLCVPVCPGGDFVARPSAVVRVTVSSKALCARLPCGEERRSRGCQCRKVLDTRERFGAYQGPTSVAVHPQVQSEQHNIFKLHNTCVWRGFGGRGCTIKALQMCGAEGPTYFLHFDCAISAPRLLLDT